MITFSMNQPAMPASKATPTSSSVYQGRSHRYPNERLSPSKPSLSSVEIAAIISGHPATIPISIVAIRKLIKRTRTQSTPRIGPPATGTLPMRASPTLKRSNTPIPPSGRPGAIKYENV